MEKLKLTYFDIHGGRAEPARLLMHIGGIEFEDHRFTFPEFAEVRKSTPLGQVPVLEINGEKITQCNAINRFIGKRINMYPQDALQALYCDEVMEAVEDATAKMTATFGLSGDALKTAREALVAGAISTYLRWMEGRLKAHGGQFFADGRLTIADIKIFVYTRSLSSGVLDHIPTNLVQTVAPALHEHRLRVAATPAIAAYYAKKGVPA